MKSETAKELGLLPWPLMDNNTAMSAATKARVLRNAVKQRLKASRVRAVESNWPTKEIVDYFAEHRTACFPDDW